MRKYVHVYETAAYVRTNEDGPIERALALFAICTYQPGQYGQSLIDMYPPYVSQGPVVNYVVSRIPQQGPAQSIWAPHSQPQMSQGGTH